MGVATLARIRPLGALLVLAIAAPHVFGLGSLTWRERRADKAIRRFVKASVDRDVLSRARRELAAIEATVPADGYWHLVARLLGRSASRRLVDPTRSGYTPRSALDEAGRDFWGVAGWQRVIGSHVTPSLFDEDVAIRTYYEDFQDALPPGVFALAPQPEITDDHLLKAERVLAELRRIPVCHPAAVRLRAAMTAEMSDELDIARGDRSAATADRQRLCVEAVQAVWAELQTNQVAEHRVRVGPGGEPP